MYHGLVEGAVDPDHHVGPAAAVLVQIDESWRHHQPFRVNGLLALQRLAADRADFSVADSHIAHGR